MRFREFQPCCIGGRERGIAPRRADQVTRSSGVTGELDLRLAISAPTSLCRRMKMKTEQAEMKPTIRKAGRKSSVVSTGLSLKRLVISTSRAPTATPQEIEICCSTLTMDVAVLMRFEGT